MRRRFVWIQGAPPASEGLFVTYQGDDGYYTMTAAGVVQRVVPYFDTTYDAGIFPFSLNTIGANDWRLTAGGFSGYTTWSVVWYGPATTNSATLPSIWQASGANGLMLFGLYQSEFNQRSWHLETGESGVGPTYPTGTTPPLFAFPGIESTSTTPSTAGLPYHNPERTWFVAPDVLMDAEGNSYPILSGAPDPWPRRDANNLYASFVGLTLYVYGPPTGGNLTMTPYTYDPATGTATAQTPVAIPCASIPADTTLFDISYWTSNPPT